MKTFISIPMFGRKNKSQTLNEASQSLQTNISTSDKGEHRKKRRKEKMVGLLHPITWKIMQNI